MSIKRKFLEISFLFLFLFTQALGAEGVMIQPKPPSLPYFPPELRKILYTGPYDHPAAFIYYIYLKFSNKGYISERTENKTPSQRTLDAYEDFYEKNEWKKSFLLTHVNMGGNSSTIAGIFASRCEDKRLCKIIISFRGTMFKGEAKDNYDIFKTELIFEDDRVNQDSTRSFKAHQGFLKGYNQIAENISKYLHLLRAEYPEAKFDIQIGGHSRGGALATLCAIHLSFHPDVGFDRGNSTIRLETFGSPRVLGRNTAKVFEKKLGQENIFRYVNFHKGRLDIIPDLPPNMGGIFKHLGLPCFIKPKGEKIYEQAFQNSTTFQNPHLIEGYLRGYNAVKGQCIRSKESLS